MIYTLYAIKYITISILLYKILHSATTLSCTLATQVFSASSRQPEIAESMFTRSLIYAGLADAFLLISLGLTIPIINWDVCHEAQVIEAMAQSSQDK